MLIALVMFVLLLFPGKVMAEGLKWTQVKSEIGINSVGSESEAKLQIMVNYSKNNSPILTLGKMKKYNGKAPKNILGDSKIKLLDENQKVIYEGKFQIPNIRMGEKVEELEKTDFAITVPFLENTKNIVIEDKNGLKIGEKSFGDYETVDNGVDYWTLSVGETAAVDGYVDFVFIGDNYKTEQELVDYFDPMMDIFGKTVYDVEPFKARKSQIRIHKIRGNYDFTCDYEGNGWCFWCDSKKVFDLVNKSGVPYDNVYVLSHRNFGGGCASYGSGIGHGGDNYIYGFEDTDYGGIYNKYPADNKYAKNGNTSNFTAVHETGHSFGNLDDEYIYGDREYTNIYTKNCCESRDISKCEGWSGNVGKNDIQKGCTSSLLFRPAYRSIMKDSSYVFFNAVSLNLVNKRIDDVGGVINPKKESTTLSFSSDIGSSNIQKINFSASNLILIHHFELLVDNELNKTYYFGDGDYVNGYWEYINKRTSFNKEPAMLLDTRGYKDGSHKIIIRAMDGMNREIGRVEKNITIDNSRDLGTKPNVSTKIDRYGDFFKTVIGINGMAMSLKGILIPYFDSNEYSGVNLNLITGDVAAKATATRILEKVSTSSAAQNSIKTDYGIKMPRQYERTGDKVFMAYFVENSGTKKYDMVLYRCLDYLCENKGKFVVESGVSEINNSEFLGSLQIEVNGSGKPVVARVYSNDYNNSSKIKLIVCGNDSCTANNKEKILVLNNKMKRRYGEIFRLFLDNEDKPYFVVEGESNYEYFLVSCKDSLCNEYTEVRKSKALEKDVYTNFLDAAVDRDGNLVILYSYSNMQNKKLLYLRCDNKLCDGNSFDNEVVVDKMDWVTYPFRAYRGSVVMDKNKVPVIGFSRYDGLWIKKGSDLALVDLENPNDNREDYNFRISLDSDNKPIMAYVGTYGKSINYLHCQTENCMDEAVSQCQDCKKIAGSGYTGPNIRGGDYNCDGTLGGGDFHVWRDEVIDKVVNVPIRADGDCSGKATVSDYSWWRTEYLK